MGLSVIECVTAVLVGACLLFFLASLFGKTSPRNVLGGIALSLVLCFGLNRMDTTELKPIENEEQNESSIDTMILPEKPENQDSINESDEPITPPADSMAIPDDDDGIAPAFRHYKAEGNWKWDKSFIEEIKKRTTWSKRKNGNYSISIDFKVDYKSSTYEEGNRKFQYAGSDIEVKVNGKYCCCKAILAIPANISASGLKEMNQKIQKKATSLLLHNKEIVIDHIKTCLSGK